MKILLCPKGAGTRLFIAKKLQPEPVHDINDLLGTLVKRLFGFFGGWVTPHVELFTALRDFSAVDFVDDIIDLFEGVGIRDNLVIRDEVLEKFRLAKSSKLFQCGVKLNAGLGLRGAHLVDDHGLKLDRIFAARSVSGGG